MILVEMLGKEKITDKLRQLIYYGFDWACIHKKSSLLKVNTNEKKYVFFFFPVFKGGIDFTIIAAICRLKTS